MSRRATAAAAALGAGLAGVGLGLAAERLTVGRRTAGRPPLERLGWWRGEPAEVKTEDGVRLYAEVDEPAGGGATPGRPTLVFCHGYAVNLDCWHDQRRALAGQVRMVSYDQRSHGRSGRSPARECTIDRLGADLAAVLDELCPDEPVVLVGHSMGGMTIMALADLHPQLFGSRVRGVCLVATSAGDLDAVSLGAPAPLARLLNRVTPAFVAALSRAPGLAEHGRAAGSDLGFCLTARYSFGSRVAAERVAFVEAMLAGTPLEVVADFFPCFPVHDRYAALAVLRRVPVVVLAGGRDLVTPVTHGRELHRRMPEAEYVELPACGHMIPVERPDAVTAAVSRLLDRCAVPVGSR